MSDKRCKWKSEYHHGYKCGEPSLPNDPDSYCILHYKNDDKDLQEFKRKVEERMNAPEEIDLRGCYFPKTFDRYYFQRDSSKKLEGKPVNFSEATFSQVVDFGKAPLGPKNMFIGGATLLEVNFRGVTFLEDVHFDSVIFKSASYFNGTTFSKVANFKSTTFLQEADFRGAKFSIAYFWGTVFEKGVNFSWAEFKDSALFLPGMM
ncbi:MAG: pentapeptide repeat-containing protein, partial [Candidatus Brocadiales bacterium]